MPTWVIFWAAAGAAAGAARATAGAALSWTTGRIKESSAKSKKEMHLDV